MPYGKQPRRLIVDASATGEYLLECGHRLVVWPWRHKVIQQRQNKRLWCRECAEVMGLIEKVPASKSFWLARMGRKQGPIVRVDQFGILLNEEDIERHARLYANVWYFVWAPNLSAAKTALKEGKGLKWHRIGTQCSPCGAKASKGSARKYSRSTQKKVQSTSPCSGGTTGSPASPSSSPDGAT